MTTLAIYRRLLGNGPLVRLLAGEFVSKIGDWLYLVALLIVVYRETNDPVLLGVVGAARVIPYIVLSVPAGIVADRFDRRLILLSTDLARGALMVVLAWIVAADGPVWAIVALAILATCFSTFFGPAIGAYLPSLARDENELGPANSAWSTLDNLGFIIGPAIGGLLIAASGLALAFVLNAVSFAIVAAVLWRLPEGRAKAVEPTVAEAGQPDAEAPAQAAGPSVPPISGIVRPLVGLTIVDVVADFAFGALNVLTVIIATDVLAAGDEATGYLNAAIGVGGLLGAVVSGPLVLRRRLGAPLIGAGIVMGAGLAGLGLTTALGASLAAMTVASTGSLLAEVVSTTIFQRTVPDAIRGRALGAVATARTLAFAAGSLLGPIAAGGFGVPTVMWGLGAAIVVAAAIGVVVVGEAANRRAEPLPDGASRVAMLPIFALVPGPRLEGIMARLRARQVTAGEAIIRQGDPADRFYVIVAGSFVVSQVAAKGGPATVLRRMGPDEVFGEIGLLTGSPRSATVVAETDGALLALDGADFLELVSAGPGLSSQLLALHRSGLVPAGRERSG